MLPHTAHTPQSFTQLAHVSGGVQRPSPQPLHWPQSSGQLKQSSFGAWQMWSPHDWQTPQSGAQFSHVSSPVQKPSPQVTQLLQSRGHELHVLCSDRRRRCRQVLHTLQSTEHVVQLSLAEHTPSPQPGGSEPSPTRPPS